jgi:hypothetical protein
MHAEAKECSCEPDCVCALGLIYRVIKRDNGRYRLEYVSECDRCIKITDKTGRTIENIAAVVCAVVTGIFSGVLFDVIMIASH